MQVALIVVEALDDMLAQPGGYISKRESGICSSFEFQMRVARGPDC